MRAALVSYLVSLATLAACNAPVPLEPYAGPGVVDAAGQRALLTLARRTLIASVTQKRGRPLMEGLDLSAAPLRRKVAVFTTLYEDSLISGRFGVDDKGLQRGCAGHLRPLSRLPDAVVLTTRTSAVADPRHARVSASEVDDITIELSLIHGLRSVSRPEQIVIGKHGALLSLGKRTATYLPQFLALRGWTADKVLARLCKKAGLPLDAWKRPGARLWVYQSQVFSEGRPGGGP